MFHYIGCNIYYNVLLVGCNMYSKVRYVEFWVEYVGRSILGVVCKVQYAGFSVFGVVYRPWYIGCSILDDTS